MNDALMTVVEKTTTGIPKPKELVTKGNMKDFALVQPYRLQPHW